MDGFYFNLVCENSASESVRDFCSLEWNLCLLGRRKIWPMLGRFLETKQNTFLLRLCCWLFMVNLLWVWFTSYFKLVVKLPLTSIPLALFPWPVILVAICTHQQIHCAAIVLLPVLSKKNIFLLHWHLSSFYSIYFKYLTFHGQEM